MFSFLRRFRSAFSLVLVWTLLIQIFIPTSGYALTSGPADPSISNTPVSGYDNMVDLFSGQLNYSIPLFDLPGPNGGYPFVLNYNSDVKMETEASWVGLGWSLNTGAINRTVRGLPDDFNGDSVRYIKRMKKNETVTVTATIDAEAFGGALSEFGDFASGLSDNTDLNLNFSYNSYNGFDIGAGVNLGFHESGESGFDLGIDVSAANGMSIRPSYSLFDHAFYDNQSYNFGLSLNSNYGVTNLGLDKTNISLMPNTFTPIYRNVQGALGFSFKYKFGIDFWGIKGDLITRGSYHYQTLDEDDHKVAYGYNYSQNATDESIMDVNRQGGGVLTKNSQNLHIPSFTYDIFSLSSATMSGTFRAYRNDVGMLYDPYQSNTSANSINVGLDANPPNGVGVDLSADLSQVRIGPWNDDNNFKASFPFLDFSFGTKQEPIHYKFIHDKSVDNVNVLDQIGGTEPLHIGLTGGTALDGLFHNATTQASLTPTQNQLRKSRPNNILSFTNGQLKKIGVNELVLPEFTYKETNASSDIRFTDTNYKDHHIGGFQVTDLNGTRQIYGLPVYNTKHVEQQFSVARQLNPPFIIDSYPQSNDYPSEHTGESDGYFNRTEKDPYPYTYLLTCVLGADYIDSDGIEGPSEGDKGYWVKFNYESLKNDQGNPADDFKWRSPFEGAYYSPGHYCDLRLNDDKASYTYGERKTFVLKSAETRSHIAEFDYELREDARGVSSEHQENGDPLGVRLPKLNRIDLYSRNDIYTPIKSVHFSHSYSLCSGVPNHANQAGKLTLNKVWFTYRNNTRGAENAYKFDYFQDNRHTYDLQKKDAWGDFKDANSIMEQVEFPLVKQSNINTQTKKEDISAWKLKSITTSEGSNIEIEYEPIDYSHVQDRKASQAFKIIGFSDDDNPSNLTNTLYEQFSDNRYVFFELDEEYSSYDLLKFREEYLSDLNQDPVGREQVRFKAMVNVAPDPPVQALSEVQTFVEGFASIEHANGLPICGLANSGSASSGSYDLGFIKLAEPKIGSNVMPYHPISFAGFQMRRNELGRMPKWPDLNNLGGSGNVTAGDILGIANNLVTRIPMMLDFFSSYYFKCKAKNWAKTTDLNYSYISLNTPDKTKIGGGARVAKIIQNDNWNAITGEADATYGLVYEYGLKGDNGEIIESYGVAANEPPPIRLENNLHSIKYHPNKTFLHAANRSAFEYPINEAYYPGPSVGHRKVLVQSLATHEGNSRTGYSTHEFYTNKDFPFFAQETQISGPTQIKTIIPIPLVGNITRNPLTLSQGYSIHSNDMHGKPKKVSHFKNYGQCVLEENASSYVKYNYHTKSKVIFDFAKNKNKVIKVLDNEVDVLLDNHTNGNYQNAHKVTKLVGVDFEIFADMNESFNKSEQYGIHANLDLLGVAPVTEPWPTVINNTSKVRTAVINKIIERKGIIKSVEALDDNSYVKTENLAFDQYTAQPIFTKLNDNYNQSRFQYGLPSYWDNVGMSAAFLSEGVFFMGNVEGYDLQYGEDVIQFEFSPGTSSIVRKHLFNGDEVICSSQNEKHKGYITAACPNLLEVYFPDGFSPALNTDWGFMISRSGKRNLLSVTSSNYLTKLDPTINRPVDNSCLIVTQSCTDCDECPSAEAEIVKAPQLSKVISLNANTFTDNDLPAAYDPYYFQCRECCVPADTSILYDPELSNPWLPSRYHIGTKGIWRPHQSYTYFANRDYSPLQVGNPMTLLDQQGFLNQVPMFTMDKAEEFVDCHPNWKLTSEITKYDEYSNPIEEKDIYDIFSSARYQDRGMVQSSIVYNSNQKDFIHFDFEDPDILPFIHSAPIWGFPHTGQKALTVDDDFTFLTSEADFEIIEDKEYWLSSWMKSEVSNEYYTYAGAGHSLIQLKFIGPNTFKQIRTVGPKIEGYQKIEGSFVVPVGTTDIEITFMPHNPVQSSSSDPYTSFDDFRIHPLDANMNTFVYDDSYKLIAKLDQNNVATGYIYDEKEKYISTKVEVETGQKTVQSISSFKASN